MVGVRLVGVPDRATVVDAIGDTVPVRVPAADGKVADRRIGERKGARGVAEPPPHADRTVGVLDSGSRRLYATPRTRVLDLDLVAAFVEDDLPGGLGIAREQRHTVELDDEAPVGGGAQRLVVDGSETARVEIGPEPRDVHVRASWAREWSLAGRRASFAAKGDEPVARDEYLRIADPVVIEGEAERQRGAFLIVAEHEERAGL